MAEYTIQSIHLFTRMMTTFISQPQPGAIVVLGTGGNNKVELLISLLNLHYFGYISLIVLIQDSGHGG